LELTSVEVLIVKPLSH